MLVRERAGERLRRGAGHNGSSEMLDGRGVDAYAGAGPVSVADLRVEVVHRDATVEFGCIGEHRFEFHRSLTIAAGVDHGSLHDSSYR